MSLIISNHSCYLETRLIDIPSGELSQSYYIPMTNVRLLYYTGTVTWLTEKIPAWEPNMFISGWLSGCAVVASQIHYRGRSGWVRLASTKDFKRALGKMRRVKKQYPSFEYSDVNRYQSMRLEVQDRISVGTNLELQTMTHPEIGFQDYTPIVLGKGCSFGANKTDQKKVLITGIYRWLVIRQLDSWLLYHLGDMQLAEITIHRIRNQAFAIVCAFGGTRGLTTQEVAARLDNQFFGHERVTVFAEVKQPTSVGRGPAVAIGSQRLPPRWAHMLCTWSEWRLFESCGVQPPYGSQVASCDRRTNTLALEMDSIPQNSPPRKL